MALIHADVLMSNHFHATLLSAPQVPPPYSPQWRLNTKDNAAS
jgi:hypothetical protein